MAMKQAKSAGQAVVVDWKAPRLQGMVFHFAGRLAKLTSFPPEDLPVIAKQHGGTVSDDLTPDVNFLVVEVPTPTSGIEKKAAKLNEKGAAIQTIASESFLEMILPSTAALQAMLTGGDEALGHLAMLFETVRRSRYKSREKVTYPKYDCRGMDLRNLDLTSVRDVLEYLDLDEADLRGVTLTEQTSFAAISSAKLDKARLYGWLGTLTNCSCVETDFSYSTLRGHVARGCDFRKADFTKFSFEKSQLEECNFEGSNWTESDAEEITAEGLSFKGACFREAECTQASFRASDFTGANFEKADLKKANFQRANFTRANFTGANLMQADLSHAIVDGADFTGAELAEVNWSGVDYSKAKGVALIPAKAVTVGPKILELSGLAQNSSSVGITIHVKTATGLWYARFSASSRSCDARLSKVEEGEFAGSWQQFATLQDAIVHVTKLLGDGALRPETLTVKGSKTGVSPKTLNTLALAALSEAFGVEVATEDTIQQLKAEALSEEDVLRATMLSELGGGPEGIKRWKERPYQQTSRPPKFHHADLQARVFEGVSFSHYGEFDHSNFDQSSFKKVEFRGSFRSVTFRGASLPECNAKNATFDQADMTGANLQRVQLENASLRGTTLKACDLRGANLTRSYLQGADLTESTVDEQAYLLDTSAYKTSYSPWPPPFDWSEYQPATCFNLAEFDEHTKFPDGRLPSGLKWCGKGVDPRNTDILNLVTDATPISSAQLHQFLRSLAWDGPRIGNALEMLKKDRFQLFADITDQHVVGVVKSQTDPDLVYSCRLTQDGAFSCCTQNLKPCGGLKGSLCKHLFVLLFGAAKSGQLRSDRIINWILASQSQSPKIDKNVMSETLLRYKGAEAGDVDWRPVETIPEDYYAL